MTSEAVELIAPDEQLKRLGYPEIEIPNLIFEAYEVISLSHSIEIPKLRGRLFFFDEANLSWCPQSGRVFRVVGKEVKVDTPGQNQTRYILGSVEYPTAEGLYEIYAHKRHEEVQAH